MLKKIIASLRWGDLSNDELDVLETMTLKKVFMCPYLCPKMHKHY
jgi:hypothetical protein